MRKSVTFIFMLLFLAFLCLGEPNNISQELFNSIFYAEGDIVVELDKIESLLDDGANPNLISAKYERSVLDWYVNLVCCSKNPNTTQKGFQAIKLLFEHGAKIQYCDRTILFSPIAQGQCEIVTILLENGTNATSKIEGMTPVEWAESYDQPEVVNILIKYGAERSSQNQAAQNRFVKWAGYSFEKTSLFEQKNIIEMEKALQTGATVNGKNSKGETALVEAIKSAYNVEEYITVAYLLQKGANPNLKSTPHFSELDGIALHHAVAFHGLMVKNGEDKAIYQQLIIEAILKAGAHVSSRGYNGMIPLHIAAKNNDAYMANILIKAGAKIMDRDDSGKTPLDYAESAEMIKFLKSHGAKEL